MEGPKLAVPLGYRLDLEAYERILIDLLDNARKHAPGACVSVRTRFVDGALELAAEGGSESAAEYLQSLSM